MVRGAWRPCPPAIGALNPTFLVGRVPLNRLQKKKGTHILTFILEDLGSFKDDESWDEFVFLPWFQDYPPANSHGT